MLERHLLVSIFTTSRTYVQGANSCYARIQEKGSSLRVRDGRIPRKDTRVSFCQHKEEERNSDAESSDDATGKDNSDDDITVLEYLQRERRKDE